MEFSWGSKEYALHCSISCVTIQTNDGHRQDMTKYICITIGHTRITAQLNDSRSAQKIWDSLPLSANVTKWGKELHFPIPVQQDLEDNCAQTTVEKGDLAFWPEGSCFCIFFGPTPISEDGEIRPASSVNVIGYIEGDYGRLNEVENLSEIKIEQS